MKKIRILLADDHTVVRRGLALVLRQESDFEIVGEAEDGKTAVSLAQQLQPDLALLDWKMPHMTGFEAANEMQACCPHVRVLVLSGAAIETAVFDALENGVHGFVHKDINPSDLIHAIRVVAGGKPYLGHELIQALLTRNQTDTSPPSKPMPRLSSRELEVLKLMATPATYREIGAALFISEETVRTYTKRILTKLNQPNRTQAVIAALRADIISLDLP
ncbi:MAG: response regulator transcription factor [Anaerolineales bacterium]|nr:response regulator transcription factor [Anaerolineales bacterium]